MNDYISLRIDANPATTDITDLAAAFLADAGFESFEPDATGLTAYIRAEADAEALAKEALTDFPIPAEFTFSSTFIEGEDWNSEWEKNYFKPIVIGEKVAVHSTFHTDIPKAEIDIAIDPKMAFGTGHHDTTSQMMRLILDSNLKGARVIDMGTGTGILAILCMKLGALEATGIEIDEPAYLNAIEHAALNNVKLNLIHGDASSLAGLPPADIFMANINRNIILQDLRHYADAIRQNGDLLLSGFYEHDVEMIEDEAARYGFEESERLVSPAGWTALRLSRK